MKGRRASGKNAIRVDASYVCNRANALFSARTARTGRPASRIARELCEATPWKVAGVDHAVGVPSTATLTDCKLLSGPGITGNTTAMPPYVRVDNTSNVVISGVDFSLTWRGGNLLGRFPKSHGHQQQI
jgi:hypothetical protein